MKENEMLIWERLRAAKKPLSNARRLEIIARLKAEKHKPGVNSDDWYDVQPELLLVAEFDLDLCQAYGLPVLYSSIIRRMLKVSKTDVHGPTQRRAYDRSVAGWTWIQCKRHEQMVNDAFDIGAISRETGKEREAVYEEDEFDKDGKQVKWKHLHFQVRRP